MEPTCGRLFRLGNYRETLEKFCDFNFFFFCFTRSVYDTIVVVLVVVLGGKGNCKKGRIKNRFKKDSY